MSFATEAIHAHCTAQATIATPLGWLLLARTARGIAGAWFEGQKHHPGPIDAPQLPHDPLLSRATRQLRDYFADGDETFDLPFDLHGTPFQRRVWQALQAIPASGTCSYADIARSIGAPQSVRAVGAAVGRNPVSVMVPCHRVLGSDGSLTGYAGGVDRKQALLALEARQAAFA
jgi:methylated-DNA-[protein]-cysteine S-methyltransferase